MWHWAQPTWAKISAPATASAIVREALRLGPLGNGRLELRAERLLGRRALVGQRAHREHDDDRGDDRHRPPREAPLAAKVDEGQRDQDREQDVRHADGADHDRVRPLEDPEQIEEEVEEPVGARDEVGRPRVGLLGDVRAEPAGILGALRR